MIHYEEDRLQCCAITDAKNRCTRIATHSNGGKVLCERHHQLWMVKRANDKPIERKT